MACHINHSICIAMQQAHIWELEAKFHTWLLAVNGKNDYRLRTEVKKALGVRYEISASLTGDLKMAMSGSQFKLLPGAVVDEQGGGCAH